MSDSDNVVMLPRKRATVRRSIPLVPIVGVGLAVLAISSLSWRIGFQAGIRKQQERDARELQASLPPGAADAGASAVRPASLVAPPAGSSSPAGGDTPPASETSVREGGVSLTTEPAGAEVEFVQAAGDYRRKGSTPLTLSDLPAGSYQMTIRHPGYRTVRTSFELQANRIQQIDTIFLESTKGALDLETNVPAQFEILTQRDGESQLTLIEKGITPQFVSQLPTGTYTLRLTRSRWPAVTRRVQVADGMTTELRHDFLEGALSLTSQPPGAEVWLRGPGDPSAKTAGKTPLEIEGIPAGRYEARIVPSEGAERSFSLLVKAGERVERDVAWRKTPVRFVSDPPGAMVFANGRRLLGSDNPVTPFTVELAEGNYRLEANHPALETKLSNLTLSSGDPEREALFQFDYGSISLVSSPGEARVLQDGRPIGLTPLTLHHVAPGRHEFVVDKERYSRKAISTRVRSGELANVEVELQYDPEPRRGEAFTNGQGQRMMWIAGFDGWAGSTELTQDIYEAVTHTNPSEQRNPAFPVTNVTWADAAKFTELLTIAERSQGFLPPEYRYDLPSDGEWSLLVRGTPLSQAVTGRNGIKLRPAPAGTLPPNPLGLHDVRGNVWEWCRDWYSNEVYLREQDEHASGDRSKIGNQFKILRGGSWNRSLESNLAAGYRMLAHPRSHKDYETGFRVVLIRE